MLLQDLIEKQENLDEDEDKLMYKVETMLLVGDNDQQQKLISGTINKDATNSDIDSAAKSPKVMKVTANMYTICYFSFMKANKEKFKLKTND